MKKLLLVTLFFITVNSFAQQNKSNTSVNNNKNPIETISKVSAYPNPFVTKTTLNFESTKSQKVTIVVKNLLSKTVFVEVYTSKKGKNKFTFNRNNLTKGMYLYSIKTDNEIISKRMVIK